LLLRHVRDGNDGASARLGAVPEVLECSAERLMDLSRVGDRRLFWRMVRGGRADLWFRNDDWWLVAELKINAQTDPGQIRSYLEGGHALVVVRRWDATQQRDTSVVGNRRWLGHVTWSSIVGGLYDLVPGEACETEWRGLLDVMNRDCDFDEARPRGSRELDATASLLREVQGPVLENLRMLLRERDGSAAEPLCERLRAFAVGGYKPWARFDIGSSKNARILIQLKGLFTGSPKLELRYQPDFTGPRKLRRDSGRELRALKWSERSVQGLDDTAAICDWCGQCLKELVDAGAFQADVSADQRVTRVRK